MEGQRTLGLKFNVSHAEEAMVCAVTRNSEVGVDLACIQEVKEARRIVEQYFSEEEAIALNKLPSTERNAAFLRCWIRKEAYVKARGEGLSLNLRGFEVFDSVDLNRDYAFPAIPRNLRVGICLTWIYRGDSSVLWSLRVQDIG